MSDAGAGLQPAGSSHLIRRLALITILCFACFLLYALFKLMDIQRELNKDLGENMIWALSRGVYESMRAQNIESLHELGRASEDEVQLFHDVLASRFSMLSEGPQRRYLEQLGVWPEIAEAARLAQAASLDHEQVQSLLRRAVNQVMLEERTQWGVRRDHHRQVMLEIFLAIFGILLAGGVGSWQMLYSLRQSMAATRESMRQRDAAERLLAALQVERKSREHYRDFVSLMSHQLLTPLAVIDSSAQRLARQGLPNSEAVMPRVLRIRGAVSRLNGLIDRVLRRLRMDEAQAEQRPVALWLEFHAWSEILGEVCERQAEFEGDSVRRVELCWGEGMDRDTQVCCDRMWCEEILSNLLSNACKYSPVDRPVQILSERRDGQWQCHVRDFGQGMQEEECEHLFKRFYRGRNGLHLQGAGLGLSIARTLARWQGGDLRASRAEEGGMCFTLSLPERAMTLGPGTPDSA